jgi:hypothetical protein
MCLLPASANCAKMLGSNHFAEPNQHVLTLLHLTLICRVAYWAHTDGVALTSMLSRLLACFLSFWRIFVFFCGGAQIMLCPFTCFFSIGDGWVALQDFVSHMEAATLQSLYLQHNYLTDFGSLSSSVLPSNVAFCVQYNCMLPPPQSLCPEQIAGIEAISRPANECATVLRSNSP